jgi:SAM-dependent methyltransferase
MTLDEVIRYFRTTPEYTDLVRDAYFDEDVLAAAQRFEDSAEFAETLLLIGKRATGTLLDLGAGRGISSYAFARAGAQKVFSLEPDPSTEVGLGALQQVIHGLPIIPFSAYAEALPIADNSCDVVYARQVLHHIADLPAAMTEVARVLKPGGIFFACREHVVNNDEQLTEFLANHPVHQMAGGENAYTLEEYVGAIREAGLQLQSIVRPWDSVITAFPAARTQKGLDSSFINSQRRRCRLVLNLLSVMPRVITTIRNLSADPGSPGRLFAFVATRS